MIGGSYDVKTHPIKRLGTAYVVVSVSHVPVEHGERRAMGGDVSSHFTNKGSREIEPY